MRGSIKVITINLNDLISKILLFVQFAFPLVTTGSNRCRNLFAQARPLIGKYSYEHLSVCQYR